MAACIPNVPQLKKALVYALQLPASLGSGTMAMVQHLAAQRLCHHFSLPMVPRFLDHDVTLVHATSVAV